MGYFTIVSFTFSRTVLITLSFSGLASTRSIISTISPIISSFTPRVVMAGPGRIEAFINDCKVISAKISEGAGAIAKVPGKAYNKVKTTCAGVKAKVQSKVDTYKNAIIAAKSAE